MIAYLKNRKEVGSKDSILQVSPYIASSHVINEATPEAVLL